MRQFLRQAVSKLKGSVVVWWVFIQPTRVFAADDLPTGEGLKTWWLDLLGNAFIALLAWGALKAFGKKNWGGLVALLGMGAVVAMFLYFPDVAIGLLKRFGTKVTE